MKNAIDTFQREATRESMLIRGYLYQYSLFVFMTPK